MLDSYVTVGPKSQVVIPKNVRQIANKIKTGAKVLVIPVDERTVIVSVKPKDWVEEIYGMFKGVWKGDATKLIRKFRDEDWE